MFDTPFLGVDGWLKRVEDLAIGAVAVTVTAPLMLAIAAGVKLSSPGPVLFRQRRYGLSGKVVEVWKFRTMTAQEDGDRIAQARRADPRVTRFGAFLRRTSLDELPQFFNVLKGEMSLVGPRPELQFIVEHYEPWQRQRLAVPPGITGWWQVSGRSDLPMHLNTQFDLYYIRNYSLWLDVKILLRTIGVVITGQGAY